MAITKPSGRIRPAWKSPLPGTDAQDARLVAERIRAAIAGLVIPHPTSPIADRLTASLGVATLVPSEDQLARDLIHRADVQLYLAKSGGRNRVAG